MKKIFFATILLASVTLKGQSTVTFNQTYPNQPTPQCDFQRLDSPIMYLCIDWVDPASGTIAGWAYDKRTGLRPTGFSVFSQVNGSQSFTIIDVPRPDVANWLGVTNQNLGFGLLTNQAMLGMYAMGVGDIPYAWDCGYDVNNGFWCGWISSQVVFTVN